MRINKQSYKIVANVRIHLRLIWKAQVAGNNSPILEEGWKNTRDYYLCRIKTTVFTIL